MYLIRTQHLWHRGLQWQTWKWSHPEYQMEKEVYLLLFDLPPIHLFFPVELSMKFLHSARLTWLVSDLINTYVDTYKMNPESVNLLGPQNLWQLWLVCQHMIQLHYMHSPQSSWFCPQLQILLLSSNWARQPSHCQLHPVVVRHRNPTRIYAQKRVNLYVFILTPWIIWCLIREVLKTHRKCLLVKNWDAWCSRP